MKKKLIIFPGYFLPHVGGVETHVDEFSKYLSKREYNITIFAPNIPLSKTKEVYHGKVKIIRYPAFELISNFPVPKFWSLKFYKLFFSLYKKNFDIVMTRTRFFSNSLLGALFAKIRFKRKKLIHVEHGSNFVILESKFKSLCSYIYDKTLGKLVFFLSDNVVSISKAVDKFVCREFVNCKKRKVPIIRRGVDLNFYEDIGTNKWIEEEFKDKTVMTFLGRLYKWKGVANTIDAYKNLPDKYKKRFVLVIVGDGEDFLRLKERCGNYFNNGIYMVGEKNFREAVSILKSTDIYVHSAYPGGGLSNSLLQAMYCNCAVISSPYEGGDEVVIDNYNGILLENNRSRNLQKGMELLCDSEEKRKVLGKNAKMYIGEEFNWEKVIDQYEKILK